MKPSRFDREKNETDGHGEALCRQFQFFFPDRIWRFHNFMPVSSMKPSASFTFDAKKFRKNIDIFSSVLRETDPQ